LVFSDRRGHSSHALAGAQQVLAAGSALAYTPDGKNQRARASVGVFYTAIPGLSAGIMYSIPPYGYKLSQSRTAAVRSALHHRRRRDEQRSALSTRSGAVERVGEPIPDRSIGRSSCR